MIYYLIIYVDNKLRWYLFSDYLIQNYVNINRIENICNNDKIYLIRRSY